MSELLQAFEVTTPTGWIISALLAVIIWFLNRFVKSIDKMEKSVETISNAMVEHKTIVDEHERRINFIEEKIF